MGIGIMIPGAHFTDERYIIGKVKIPEEPVPECEHIYDNACDTTCNLCGAIRTVTHNLVHYDAVAPTDTEDGNKEYWRCTICGGYWLDEACTQPTTADGVVLLSIGSYPVKETLKGLFVLGGTEEASLKNHKKDGANATVLDNMTVEYEQNYAKFSGAQNQSRIDTNVQVDINNSPIAFVALFRVPKGQSNSMRTIIGNRRAYTPSAVGLDMQNGIVEYCANKTALASGTIEEGNTIVSDNFIILAMTASTAGYALYRYTNGDLTALKKEETAVDGWTYPYASDAIKIGGNGLTTTRAEAHISLAAIHEGEMNEGQLEDVCRFVKAYGEQKGLTIE